MKAEFFNELEGILKEPTVKVWNLDKFTTEAEIVDMRKLLPILRRKPQIRVQLANYCKHGLWRRFHIARSHRHKFIKNVTTGGTIRSNHKLVGYQRQHAK